MATETRDTTVRTEPASLNRRQFFAKLTYAVGGIGAALLGVPVVGFLIAPLIRRAPEIWRPVGAVESFQVGETVLITLLDPSPLPWAGVAARSAAWLRRESDDSFVAFAINCTHLGCPVRWLPDANLFMCPCHGGVFYRDGNVAAGPPPRGLYQYNVRVREGQVEILTGTNPIAA